MMRIALIHATPVAMEPIADAFRRLWPDVDLANVMDDSLPTDLDRRGSLTGDIAQRILLLSRYAETLGSAGILFTCSAFGAAIRAAASRSDLPILRPNEAMFDEARAKGGRVGFMATFAPSVDGLIRELVEADTWASQPIKPEVVCVPEALQALRDGDAIAHDRLLAQASERLRGFDSVMLTQFSMARARTAVAEKLGFEPLTAPDSAVRKMKLLVSNVP